MARPYTSQWHGLRCLASDLLKDYCAHKAGVAEAVSHRIEEAQAMEQRVFGHRLANFDILDIGPGQVPVQLSYFNLRNHAVGIDVNRIIEHRTPLALLTLAREDGMVRALKTFGRWLISMDSKT